MISSVLLFEQVGFNCEEQYTLHPSIGSKSPKASNSAAVNLEDPEGQLFAIVCPEAKETTTKTSSFDKLFKRIVKPTTGVPNLNQCCFPRPILTGR